MKKLLSILIVALSLITISAKSQGLIDSVSITVGGQTGQIINLPFGGGIQPYYVISAPCHNDTVITVSTIDSSQYYSYKWVSTDTFLESNRTDTNKNSSSVHLTEGDLGLFVFKNGTSPSNRLNIKVFKYASFYLLNVKDTTYVINTSALADTSAEFLWYLGSSSSSVLTNVNQRVPKFTTISDGVDTINLVVTNTSGCSDTASYIFTKVSNKNVVDSVKNFVFVSASDTISLTNIFNQISTSIDEIKIVSKINVYPNPTTDFINIPKNANSIEIFNSIGQLENKFEYVNSRINIKDLFAGIYVINYTLDEHMYTGRFVKQ